MTIQQITIFNDNLDPSTENLSSTFTQGLGFYLIAPTFAFNYQIDVFLQVQLSNTTFRQVRLDPLNVSTTQRITLIPPQIVELGLPMRLSIVPSKAFALDVVLLQSDCTLCTLDAKLDEILETLETVGTEDFQNSLVQFLVDNLLPLAINALLPGVNNLLLTVINNVLLPGIQNLLPGGSAPALPGASSSIALTGTTVNAAAAPGATTNFSATRFT